ncbi:MAG: hypothetical protein HUJ25_18120 [Crocinitomicaceae bacterium]|nr:hypothetical protein [Crocinitomicaceae bacterium]
MKEKKRIRSSLFALVLILFTFNNIAIFAQDEYFPDVILTGKFKGRLPTLYHSSPASISFVDSTFVYQDYYWKCEGAYAITGTNTIVFYLQKYSILDDPFSENFTPYDLENDPKNYKTNPLILNGEFNYTLKNGKLKMYRETLDAKVKFKFR